MGEIIKSNSENTQETINKPMDFGIELKNDPSKVKLTNEDLLAQNEEDDREIQKINEALEINDYTKEDLAKILPFLEKVGGGLIIAGQNDQEVKWYKAVLELNKMDSLDSDEAKVYLYQLNGLKEWYENQIKNDVIIDNSNDRGLKIVD